MLSSKEMITLQAEEHALVNPDTFLTKEEYALHLIGKSAYFQATRLGENKVVLDYGCNTGFGTDMISTKAKKVVGVDVAERALSVAMNRYKNQNIEFKQVDGETLPFNEHEFDMVVSFQVIEHIIDYSKYLTPISRVLKPDGFVLFTTPNAQLRLDPGMKPWNKFHVREFTHDELKTLLEEYFTAVQVVGLDAIEPLHSIELQRLLRTREAARKNISNPLRRLIKSTVPEKWQKNIKALLNSAKLPDDDMQSFIKAYDVQNIFYRTDHLDTALDYLAICSNDGTVPEKVCQSLPRG